jgi:hypothetical protein
MGSVEKTINWEHATKRPLCSPLLGNKKMYDCKSIEKTNGT